MEIKSAYSNLAEWFEYLNDDCGYENWSQYLILRLKDYNLYKGLDIGCGSGWFTRSFQKAGYLMTGMDVSLPMLDKAEKLSLKEGIRPNYILGDITKFKSFEKYDFAIAINDCINYIPKGKLKTAFKNVRSILNKNGIFFFDISSKNKFLKKIANTVSVDDRNEVTYMSFNHLEDEKAIMDVSLFILREDGLYERQDEQHIQYIYEEQEIQKILEESGFEVIDVKGHLDEDKNESDRINFLVKRK